MDKLNKRIVSYIDFISTLEYYDNSNTFSFKYYIPDILIYTDNSFSIIQRIIEVKPKKFLNMNINILKRKCLKEYCISHKYKYSFITLEKIKKLERLLINEN